MAARDRRSDEVNRLAALARMFASPLKRTALLAIFAAVVGLGCAGLAWAETSTPGLGSSSFKPAPGSTVHAPNATATVTIHWSAICLTPPSDDDNPAVQHYWSVHAVALHEDGSQANYDSTAELNVDDASGTYYLVLTMAPGLHRETFSVRVSRICGGNSIVFAQSTLTLVRGSKHSGGGGSSSGSGSSGSGSSGPGSSGSGSSGSGSNGAHCVVPKLVGKTLAAARKLLAAAHCKLGKVTAPQASPGLTLLVTASSPKAGTLLVSGTRVDVKLRET
jgi:hypothetical protein